MVATLLAIIQIIQGCVSDMQSSQQLDEISTKIEEHWVEEDKQVEKIKNIKKESLAYLKPLLLNCKKKVNPLTENLLYLNNE